MLGNKALIEVGNPIFLTKLYNDIIILTVLDIISEEGDWMNYIELAKQLLHNTYQFRSNSNQKKINETMQGETFALLYILRRDGIVLPSEISDEMNISSARVAAILNNLEDKGLILRQIDKNDRRRILVDLTQDGIKLAENYNQMVVNLTVRMLELLGEYDATEFVRIMGKLAELAPKITNGEQCGH